jgi:hypothetical protein
MGLWPVCLILMALWFLIYGVSGVSTRPIQTGVVLGVIALVLGIVLLIVVAGGLPLRN